MSYMNIRPQDGFWRPALVIGIITIVGALWEGILNQFQDFLLIIGTLFIPVFAIMLADYFVAKRGSYAVEEVLRKRGGWCLGEYNVPTFVLTFVLYLVARAAADRLSTHKTAVETDHEPG